MLDVKKLKAKMVLADHTQASLAIATGMSKTAVHDKVNGKRPLNCDEVDRICAALGITDPVEKVEIFLT